MFRRALVASFVLSVSSRPGRAQAVWRVGINPGGAPFSFRDAQSGTDKGVAVELIRIIGQQAGVPLAFLPLAFAELIPALADGGIDVIAANILATPERAARVDFSEPIAKGGDGLVVSQGDTRAYGSMQDLAGLPAGSQAGSPFAEAMKQSGLFPQLTIYPTGADAMRAVTREEIKAAIVGVNSAAYEIKLRRFPDLRLVTTYKPLVDSVDAFAVRKGDRERLRVINDGLTKLRSDGTLRAVLEKYGSPRENSCPIRWTRAARTSSAFCASLRSDQGTSRTADLPGVLNRWFDEPGATGRRSAAGQVLRAEPVTFSHCFG